MYFYTYLILLTCILIYLQEKFLPIHFITEFEDMLEDDTTTVLQPWAYNIFKALLMSLRVVIFIPVNNLKKKKYKKYMYSLIKKKYLLMNIIILLTPIHIHLE